MYAIGANLLHHRNWQNFEKKLKRLYQGYISFAERHIGKSLYVVRSSVCRALLLQHAFRETLFIKNKVIGKVLTQPVTIP